MNQSVFGGEILYDKIIDVELLSTERNVQISTILANTGLEASTEGMISRTALKCLYIFGTTWKKSLARGWYTEKEAYKFARQHGYTIIEKGDPGYWMHRDKSANPSIAIYSGYSHKEYYESEGNLYSREVKAIGRTVHVSADESWGADDWYTHEDFIHQVNTQLLGLKDQEAPQIKDGFVYHPDIETGIRILVTKNGRTEKYHAVLLKEDVINTRSYVITDRISITCPKTGIKPTISFSVGLIPGMNCYKLVLKITNLNLDVDIRKINRVIVKAGYRTQGFVETFECDVFSSYIESPNPDGITVFNCLAVGKTGVFTQDTPIRVHYRGGKITIHEIIVQTCNVLGIVHHDLLAEELQNIELDMAKMDTLAESATALLDWLRKVIVQAINYYKNPGLDLAGASTEDPGVIVQMTSDGLYVYCTNYVNADSHEDDGVINLDMVNGATFNGVALTAKSVWNPAVRPGRVFMMRPSIINGANLPNTVTDAVYGNDEAAGYKFRCITVAISFSTTGSENEMTIQAVPIKYIETDYSSIQNTRAMEEFAQKIYDEYKANVQTLDVYLGSGEEGTVSETSVDQQKVYSQEEASTNMLGVNARGLLGSSVVTEYQVVVGDSLSKIAEAWYNPKGAPDGKVYFEGPIDCDPSTLVDPMDYKGASNGILPYHFWPLIAVYTYQSYMTAQSTAINKYQSFQNLSNTDFVSVGKYVVIPRIGTFNQLRPVREIFKWAALSYKDVPGYDYFVAGWTTIINI